MDNYKGYREPGTLVRPGRPATRLYGLFEVHVDENGKKTYVRLYPSLALPLARARKAFQNSLLAFALDPNCKNARELRPINKETK